MRYVHLLKVILLYNYGQILLFIQKIYEVE